MIVELNFLIKLTVCEGSDLPNARLRLSHLFSFFLFSFFIKSVTLHHSGNNDNVTHLFSFLGGGFVLSYGNPSTLHGRAQDGEQQNATVGIATLPRSIVAFESLNRYPF